LGSRNKDLAELERQVGELDFVESFKRGDFDEAEERVSKITKASIGMNVKGLTLYKVTFGT
jgi:hypothetical protein